MTAVPNLAGISPVTLTAQSSDPLINGILSGIQWAGTVTYSDPTLASQMADSYDPPTSFSRLSDAQLLAYHFALDADTFAQPASAVGFSVEGFTNLTVTYTGADGSGQIRAANASNSDPTAYAYYPGSDAAAGDVYFGASLSGAPAAGNYLWLTTLHELGHTLGLKHPHDPYDYGIGQWPTMPQDHDSME